MPGSRINVSSLTHSHRGIHLARLRVYALGLFLLSPKSRRKENTPMPKDRYIASCSFGKDSLSAIICRVEHGEPVDESVYCRVMFDNTISAEYPEHEDWIHSKAIPLLKSRYGISTTIVQGDVFPPGCFLLQ
jgi:hypothetical protein